MSEPIVSDNILEIIHLMNTIRINISYTESIWNISELVFQIAHAGIGLAVELLV
jgi:hypothetical protein